LIGGACSVAVVALAASGILIARTKSGAPEEIEAVQDFEVVDFDEVSTFSFEEEAPSDEIAVTEEFVEIAPAAEETLDMHFFEDLAAGVYDDALDVAVVYFETETTGNPEDDIVLNGLFSDALQQIVSNKSALIQSFTDYTTTVVKGYQTLRSSNASATDYLNYTLEAAKGYVTGGIEVVEALPTLVSPITDLIKGISSWFA
jgi:hypothetical protein